MGAGFIADPVTLWSSLMMPLSMDKLRENVLLVVDLLLGVHDEVLIIICAPSSFGSLVVSSGFAYLLQNFTCFFIGQTNLQP